MTAKRIVPWVLAAAVLAAAVVLPDDLWWLAPAFFGALALVVFLAVVVDWSGAVDVDDPDGRLARLVGLLLGDSDGERMVQRAKVVGLAVGAILFLPLAFLAERSALLAIGVFVFVALVAVVVGLGVAVWHTNRTVEPMDLGQL